MQSTVLDRIIELGYLQVVSAMMQVSEKLHNHTRDGSNFSCFTSQKSSKSFSQRSRNNHGSSSQHLQDDMSGQHAPCARTKLDEPSFLDLVDVQRFPVFVHNFTERRKKVNNLL